MKKINFENESINLIKTCCDYLYENNFYQNNILTNIELLEQSLINYSILKLYDWDVDLNSTKIDDYNNLELILNFINNKIETNEEKYSYFVQYVYSIIFILGKLYKQPEINWKYDENQQDEITYIYDKEILKYIVTNQNIKIHEIPTKLLKNLKEKHKEKILTK